MALEDESNPYASPVTNDPGSSFDEPTPKVSIDFLPIMRRWERLRLFYNGILVVFVLFLTLVVYPDTKSEMLYWFYVCIGGVVANLCFLTGPTIEAYGRCFRLWNDFLTLLLFLAGLGFTALLALEVVASY